MSKGGWNSTSPGQGTRSFTEPGSTADACAKAAQVCLAKKLALELARDRVRANVICPGSTVTKINASVVPAGRRRLRAPDLLVVSSSGRSCRSGIAAAYLLTGRQRRMGAVHAMANQPMEPDQQLIAWVSTGTWAAVAEATAGWLPDDWERFRHAAQIHGLAPRLAVRLGPLAIDRAELKALEDWLSLCRRLNVERTTKLRQRLTAVLAAARDAGATVMVLKGAALLDRFGTNPDLRATADIDLMSTAEDEDRLHAALQEVGYRLGPFRDRHRRYMHVDDGWVGTWLGEHPKLPLNVETHTHVRLQRWSLLDSDLTARLWDHSTAGEVMGLPAVLPSAGPLLEHLLLHLAEGLVVSRGRALRALDFAPVAAALEAREWPELVESLAAGCALRWAWLSVAMARQLGPLPLPAAVDEALLAEVPARFRATAEGASWAGLSLCRAKGQIQCAAWQWATRPGHRARLASSLVAVVSRKLIKRLPWSKGPAA